jgi:hypothetical protein
VQLGSYVPNARTHVSKAPDVRAIMGLQDVRVGNTVNACKMCRQAAIVPGDPTAWRHAANRVQRGRMTGPDVPTPLKTSFATSSLEL